MGKGGHPGQHARHIQIDCGAEEKYEQATTKRLAASVHEQSMNHISLKKKMLYKVTHCACSANTRPHQLHWGDREMGTAISCTKYSQLADLIL